jgi:hypothetical protein
MRKYERNKKICNLSQYEKAREKTKWFILLFHDGHEKTIHIGFLESLQLRTFERFINRGMLYSAKEVKNDT